MIWHSPLTQGLAIIREVLHAERVMHGTGIWFADTAWSHSSVNYKCLLVLLAMHSGTSSHSLLRQLLAKRFSPYLIAMRSVLKVNWPEIILKGPWSGILDQC